MREEADLTAAPALRPYLTADAQELAELFRSSIAELAAEDYDETQLEAWMSRAEDEEAFAAKLGKALTLVATLEGETVGFAALVGNSEIEMLYVAPEAARRGVATLLLRALEKLAAARGARTLTTDASDTAEPFFKARGFIATSRNTIIIGDAFLGTTTMTKVLAPPPASTDSLQ